MHRNFSDIQREYAGMPIGGGARVTGGEGRDEKGVCRLRC